MDGYVDLKTRLKGMNRKEKIEHIWDYYRLPIIGTIVAIIVIYATVSQMMSNKTPILTVVTFDGYVNPDKSEDMCKKLQKDLLKNTNSKEKVDIQSMLINGSDPQMQSASLQKFTAMVASGEIDVVLMPKDAFEPYAKQRLFRKIDDKMLKELNIQSSKRIKYKMVKDKKEYTYGIDISGNKKLSKIGYNSDDKFIGFVNSAAHIKNAKKFMSWMLK